MSAKPPTLDEALALHRAGRAEAAQDAYRAILARQPGQPDALHGLGVLCAGRGGLEGGQSRISRATEERAGAAAWYPAGQRHTIHNPTTRPATYLMYK